MTTLRRFLQRRAALARWAAEIAGVSLLSYAAWLVFTPLGAALPGIYLILIANQEVQNARTR